MQFLLVHSPVVGPLTWRPVADALIAGGHGVVVPDLRAAAELGEPQAVIEAAVRDAGPAPQVLVGHSGAGLLLPSIAAGLGDRVELLVFVDAGVPPCEGETTAGTDIIDLLRGLAVEGRLPAWSDWWGDEVMEALLPDPQVRTAFVDELPTVPLPFFERPVVLPTGWCETRSAYVLLSEAYRPDAHRARAAGWPTTELLGSHLDLVTRPNAVAQAILEMGSTTTDAASS